MRIIEARHIAPGVKHFRLEAPKIARRRRPGQFVILRVDDHGERIVVLKVAYHAEDTAPIGTK